ncbi:MFS transporter [Actinomyces radicidentis]|uniref:MFS transporter n=1 Tax=Actinomyces radicidentis TaxID=111015 RepID=UPI0026E0DF8D|nr:MFS transporter [Actinomyces radicidentis]
MSSGDDQARAEGSGATTDGEPVEGRSSPAGTTAPAVSVRAVLTTPLGHLALAMLVVELLAGMQTYLNQTVLPLVATDLGARAHYGLITGAAMVPTFLTMPLGGAMLARWRADRLMTVLTAVLVVGAILGATAPVVAVYVAGEVVRGLASGALATVTAGVLVAGLPEAWRRLFLAASSAMWIVSSLVGPVYAAGVSAAWGWRWALVVYVPVLVAARLVMACEIHGLRVTDDGEARPPVVPAIVMAAGVAVIGLVPAGTVGFAVAGPVGLAAVAWACLRVLPRGVARLVPGRPTAIATLAWVCGAYFALDFLVSPAGHDVLRLSAGSVGWALTTAGVLWSAVALHCGAHPARELRAYLARTSAGGLLFAVGGALIAGALGGLVPWWGLHAGWGLAGLGMGLTHQDTIIRCVTDPAELGNPADGISQAAAATSVTVAVNAGGAALGTLVTSLVAPTSAGVQAGIVVPTVLVLTAALAVTPLLARRAA